MSAAAPSTGALARAAPPALSCVLLFAAGAHGAHDGGVEHVVPQATAVAKQKIMQFSIGIKEVVSQGCLNFISCFISY